MQTKQANSENCGPSPGNNFDLVVGLSQGHGMVQNERACHNDFACQIPMLYHWNLRRYEPV